MEGSSGKPIRVDSTCYRMTIATGTSRKPGEFTGRQAQLSTVNASMAMRVSARFADGSFGPRSVLVNVGTSYPKQ
jgi:hypothetical protein